ncbi:hypothetical protein ACTJKJ_18545 [Roseateles sp. 22389]|uniref:hypothetical protein n=1 Tax=Roseateles sp. 22389 TaxID=3453916 RepID=UPI003F82E05B
MQTVVLPLWVEYVKALGAPVVALIAALLAGSIAYRQWSTARSKLKLDLFEKRLKVYDAAWQMIATLNDPKTVTIEHFKTYLLGIATARWLYGPEVTTLLIELQRDAQRALGTEYDFEGPMSRSQRVQEGLDYFARLEGETTQRFNRLNALMVPYLTIKH